MKFTVSSSKLFAQMQVLGKVIAPKNSLQILESILFDLADNCLTLTASDGATSMQTKIEVENVQGAGKVTFGAKMLLDALKEFPEQPLTFDINDQNFGLQITSDNGNYSFVGANGNEYPEMIQSLTDAKTFNIPADTLLTAINRTIFCTADDEMHPIMSGIFFDITEEKTTFVATDAHRIVRYINLGVKAAEPMSFILPKKPASLLKNVLNKEAGEVTITARDENICFDFGQTIIICRQIAGRFPNYNAVIPVNNPNKITIDRLTILNAIKRVGVFASQSTNLIKLSLNANTLNISAQDIDFSTSAEETVMCSYEGEDMAIGFKAPFLIELIGAIDSNDVIIEFSNPSRAGLILPFENAENEDLVMALTPLFIHD